MSSHNLDGAWAVLSTSPPSSGILVVPTGGNVTAGPLLGGVDSDGSRYLLIPLLPGEAAKTDKRSRGVQLRRQLHDGTNYLAVVCLEPELFDVFAQFCRELIATIEHSNSPANETSGALQKWRALFSDGTIDNQVGEETLIGLIGELLVVEQLLALGAPTDLRYWVGPKTQVHDLRSPSHAIEVKATLIREGRIVSISSVDQLAEPSGADLTLIHIRLKPEPSGLNLSGLSDKLLAAGADLLELRERLDNYGVRPDRWSSFDDRRYQVAETRGYDVAGYAFPRLIRSSFVGGDLPVGTLRLSYSIDLTNEPPLPLDDAALDSVLKKFADEASLAMDS